MSPLSTLTAAQLRRYADLKEQIENLEAELSAALGHNAAPANTESGKRTMSPAARARIAAAQRARWAKLKGAKPEVRKGRRKMSAATRAKMAAVAKARWAKAKAAGKSTL